MRMPSRQRGDGLPPATRKTILVIDDDVARRAILCRIADLFGFAAIGAATLDDAEVLLGSHRFDCITVDRRSGSWSRIDGLDPTLAAAAVVDVSEIARALTGDVAAVGEREPESRVRRVRPTS